MERHTYGYARYQKGNVRTYAPPVGMERPPDDDDSVDWEALGTFRSLRNPKEELFEKSENAPFGFIQY